MSQNVNNILAAISKLNAAEKSELLRRIGGSSSNRSYPVNESFGRKHEGASTINFAPRTGVRCPACGK
ncbi:hypothetical protein [Vibrio cholerae]|uniref:hypothetical protein n=1 Tax=Vibrio cholerae TaxID=666 RepID=UPI001C2FC919